MPINLSVFKCLRTAAECKGPLKLLIGEEGLLKLAKDGLLPHYVITNPITKEQGICFSPSQINEWFLENNVHQRESFFTPKYEFLFFDKKHYRAGMDGRPLELIKIIDLFEIPMASVKAPSGVYFLCKDQKIQYIGQAINVYARVVDHDRFNEKEFNKVFFIAVPESRLFEVESALIRYLKPPLNKTSKLDGSETQIKIAEQIINPAIGID